MIHPIQTCLEHMESAPSLPQEEIVEKLDSILQLIQAQLSDPAEEWTLRIAKETHHSPQLISYCAQLELNSWSLKKIEKLLESYKPHFDPTLSNKNYTALILSGNVFTAALRPIILGLLAGQRLLLKVSDRNQEFVALFHRTLHDVAPGLAQRLWLTHFAHDDTHSERLFFSRACRIIAYGSNETLSQIQAHAPKSIPFIQHGHGLGAVYIDEKTLPAHDKQTQNLTDKIALDIAAYDQQGCLSPQLIAIRTSNPNELVRFAETLHENLEVLGKHLPLTPHPHLQAEVTHWRRVASSLGTVFSSEHGCVSAEWNTAFRPSPGRRMIQVIPCQNEQHFFEVLGSSQPFLKVIGTPIQNINPLQNIAARTAELQDTRVCKLGTMQSPSADVPWDGYAPFDEFS